MKTLLIILFVIQTLFINAQVINWNNFSEKTMNDVMIIEMSKQINSNRPFVRSSTGHGKIYKCIKKCNEKLSVDDISVKINERILSKYDTETIINENQVGNVGLLNAFNTNGIKTYQDIATKSITDWNNSVDVVVFLKWSNVINAVSYYNKKTNTVYVFFGFFK
jgi:hypothetical protein